MLETRATVMQIHDHSAVVRANQVSGCEQCNGQGCGSSKVAQLFCSEPRQFEVENPIGAAVGDEVIISVSDGAVLHGIALLYVWPLVLMVVGGVLASVFSHNAEQSDTYAAIGGIAGLLSGFVYARWFTSRQARQQSRPFITRHWQELG